MININLRSSMGLSKGLVLFVVLLIKVVFKKYFHIINVQGLMSNLKLHEEVDELKNLGISSVTD